MRIILLFLATLLFANEKYLIAKFQNLKPYYYNNQIVNLTLKIISAKDGNISVSDDNNKTYAIKKYNSYYISNINFELNNTFPIFYVSLKDNNVTQTVEIKIDSNIKQLYPPKNFCGVLADNIIISDKILTNYDNNHNIVYWTIQAKNGNLEHFKLHKENEKLYFLDKNNSYSSYSYSAIVPIDKRKFSFSYFNLNKESYKTISFNVLLKNDTISTQTDVKPMAKSNIYIINIVLVLLIILWVVLYIYRRKIIYIILIILSIISIIFLNLPKQEIILKEGTKIHILPFEDSTIFVVVGMDTKVKVLDHKDGYKKIEFNKYIGWVKDE